jgi:hypothetical protein
MWRLFALLAMLAAAGAWSPPADDVLTEPQLQVYLETARDWQAISARLSDAFSRTSSDAERSAILADLSAQHHACLDRHGISDSEYKWIARRATDAWSVVSAMQGADDPFMTERDEQCRRQIKEAQATIAKYQEALKEGRWVMMAEDRAAAIASAQSDETSCLRGSRLYGEEAKTATDEEDRDRAEESEAMALANNPPDDVPPKAMSQYRKHKLEQSAAAATAAAQALARANAALQSMTDALARSAMAAQIADDPTMPRSDEDIAQARDENLAQIKYAQARIDECNEDLQRDAIEAARLNKNMQTLRDSIPEQNIELMQKHFQDFVDVFSS